MRAWRAGAMIVAAVALLLFVRIGLFILRASPQQDVMPSVSVYLPGTPSQVSGLEMSMSNGMGSGDLMEPQRLTLHTTDGASMSVVGRSSSVTASGGRINAVYVRRPMRPVRFLQAKADMLQTLSLMGIQPDRLMREQMASWTDDVHGYGELPGLIPYDWKAGIRTPFHGLIADVQISPDPGGGWYYLLIFGAVNADSIPCISPAAELTTQPTTQHPEGIDDISAKLLGTTRDVTGAELRVRPTGMDEADLLQPQNLTLTLPNGRAIYMAARSSNIMFFDGVAHGVFVRRPMETVSFERAREDMLRTLANLHVKPDRVMKSMMSDWEGSMSAAGKPRLSQSYQAAIGSPIDGAQLTVRLCPDSDDKWYYLLIFSVGK